jgi:hypothetical protein
MSSQTAEPTVNLRSPWAAAALPWMLSTTAHAGLLLALTFYWAHDRSPSGVSTGGLNVIFVSAADGVDRSEAEAANLAQTLPADQYWEDEPAAISLDASEARGAKTVGRDGGLDALLNEKPAVSLAGVLPAAGLKSPTGGNEGPEIGSAGSLTSRPQGSSRLRGGSARTSVFGAIGEGRKFVYVFDRSGSMDGHGGAPLQAAKAELIASLKDLGQTHQFQIIFYNEHPRLFTPSGTPGRLVFGTDQNKYLAQKFVGSITADGATRHEDALEMAVKMAPDVIFFLTDADEPRLSTKQLLHVAQRNAGTTINAIEFGFGAQADLDNFLVKLARQNGGTHVYVDVSRLSAARR